jgi:hypothetical protein
MKHITRLYCLITLAVSALVAFLPQGKAQTPNGTLVYQDDFSVSNAVWQFGLNNTDSDPTAIAASYGMIQGGYLQLKANVDCGWDYLNSIALLNMRLPAEFAVEYDANKLQWCGAFTAAITKTNDFPTDAGPSYHIWVAGNSFGYVQYYPTSTLSDSTNIANPVTTSMNDGQWYHWRIEKRRSSLIVYVNGALQYSYSGTLFSGGFLELRTYQAGSTAQVDNLKIYDLGTALSISPAAFNLNWLAQSNVSYQLQWSTNLQTWNVLTNIIGAGFNTNIVDWVSGPKRFYRVTTQ